MTFIYNKLSDQFVHEIIQMYLSNETSLIVSLVVLCESGKIILHVGDRHIFNCFEQKHVVNFFSLVVLMTLKRDSRCKERVLINFIVQID